MKIISWLNNSINSLNKTNYVSIHLDELMINDEYISNGIKLLKQIKNELEKNDSIIGSLRIDLQFELVSKSNMIGCVPNSFDELIKHIDIHSSPELIISKRQKGYIDYVPKIEYYMSPVPFDMKEISNTSFQVHYSEYRTIDELIEGEAYSRWFNITFFSEGK